MTDRELLARIAEGDVEALGELYDGYAPLVYQFALALTRSRDAAEDVVQNTFLGLLKSRRELARVENLRAYLLRIVRNEASHLALTPALSHWERERVRDAVALELVEARDDVSAKEVAELNEALSRLPEEQLTVVVLKVWHGMTFAEIAEALAIPANTAASRYRYAMEKLRTWLT